VGYHLICVKSTIKSHPTYHPFSTINQLNQLNKQSKQNYLWS